MDELKGFQKKYLRGLAHSLKPVVFIGQKGITDSLEASVNEALDAHELIKIKFIEFKEKKQKEEVSAEIIERTGSVLAGIIGHMAIIYRPHKEKKKRNIKIPKERKDIV